MNLPILSLSEAAAGPDDDRCYRKGYRHGYSKAMDDMIDLLRGGDSARAKRPMEAWNLLARFYDGVLYPWSRRGAEGFDPPPVFDASLVPTWLDLREQVFARDGRFCAHCGAQHALQIDHIVPVAEGGTNDLENLRVLCLDCNRWRNRKPSFSDPKSKSKLFMRFCRFEADQAVGRERVRGLCSSVVPYLRSEALQCGLISIVAPDEKTVVIFVPKRHWTDMTGAICMAKTRSPNVEVVQVFSGVRLSSVYVKESQGWTSVELPQGVYP